MFQKNIVRKTPHNKVEYVVQQLILNKFFESLKSSLPDSIIICVVLISAIVVSWHFIYLL